MTDQLVQETIEQLARERDELFQLSSIELRRRYIDQPALDRITFGAGEQAQQTLLGNQKHLFYGVAVFNPTGKPIYVGFSAGTSQGSPTVCLPGELLVWPAKFSEVSLAVSASDAAGPLETVTVLRLQAPPAQPMASVIGPSAASALTATSPVNPVVVGLASAAVIAGNTLRRGLSIVNPTKVSISLGLGVPAVLGAQIVLEPAGSWNGTTSGVLWKGAVNSIAAEAATLAVVEV